MNPFDIFDKVYCIHLPHEVERKTLIEEQFESVGILDRVTFIDTTPPPAKFTISNMQGRGAIGNMGVNLSQIKAIVHAISDNAQQPIFFEDDIVFNPNAKEMLSNVLNDLPELWNMLYMGGHPRGPLHISRAKKISDSLAQVQRYSFGDAYTMKRDSLLAFFDFWCENITQERAMYDIILGNFAATQNTYATYPLICTQRPGVSSISLKQDNKSELVARGWATHLGIENVSEQDEEITLAWQEKTGRSLKK